MNQSPSCNLHESSLPDGFLHSSLKKLVSTRALLSFEGRFVEVQVKDGIHLQSWEGSGSREEQLL